MTLYMETILQSLEVIRGVAWSMYLGLMLAFAILSVFSEFDLADYLKWFSKFGVVLGLSLGATLLPSIVLVWFERGSYYPQGTLETVGVTIGFVMWVSNIILEIWTLDPIRKYDLNILDERISIDAKRQRALSHIRLHAVLCVATSICLTLAV